VETKFVPAGAILFRPGQVDDSIYVVRNGKLKVYIIEQVRRGGKERGEGGGMDGRMDGQTLESGIFSISCFATSSQDGSELPLKEAGPGDSVHSMLSILDAITGHPKPFKTVTAKAIRDSYVLQ